VKIVCVCDEGNNRSVIFAGLLRYKYNAETIAIGINRTSKLTQEMLFDWADYIIITHGTLKRRIDEKYYSKMKLFDVGSDRKEWARPYNRLLLPIAKRIIEANPL